MKKELLPGQKALIIGDIHGCFDELMQLIEKSNIGPDDLVISVGDLIDRGPKSFETVAWFARDCEKRIAIMGNHEAKHLKCAGGNIFSLAGKIVRKQISEDNYLGMLDYFGRMPKYIELGDKVIITHAGIDVSKSLVEQEDEVLMGIGSSRRDGFNGVGEWWFNDIRLPDDKIYIFGHEKHECGVVRGLKNNVYGIDTGASVGGQLTGLLLPNFELISVNVKDYWSEEKLKWLPQFVIDEIDIMKWSYLFDCYKQNINWPENCRDLLQNAVNDFNYILDLISKKAKYFAKTNKYWNANKSNRKKIIEKLNSENTDLVSLLAVNLLKGKDAKFLLEKYYSNYGKLKKEFEQYLINR